MVNDMRISGLCGKLFALLIPPTAAATPTRCSFAKRITIRSRVPNRRLFTRSTNRPNAHVERTRRAHASQRAART